MPFRFSEHRQLWLLFLVVCFQSGLFAQPLTVAHRGGPKLGAENALSTFEKAMEHKVDAIELDIHQSRDGGLVVIHDSNLKRTHGVEGEVDQMTTEELLTAGVPTLQQAIELTKGRCRLFIEIKHPHGRRHQGIEERLLKVMRDNDLWESAVVISFDPQSLKTLHELESKVVTGWLVGDAIRAKEVDPELGVTYISPHYGKVDRTFVEWAHRSGYQVSVWTVDDPQAIEQMLDIGCDAITTNDPVELIELTKASRSVK